MTRQDIEPLRPASAGFSRLNDTERARIGQVLSGMQQREAAGPAPRRADTAPAPARPPAGRKSLLILGGVTVACMLFWGFEPAKDRLAGGGIGLPFVATPAPAVSAVEPAVPPAPAPQPATEAPQAQAQAQTAPAAPSDTKTPGPAIVLQASGTLVAKRMATVSASVTGRLAEVLVAEGDTVTAGQPIARLDTDQAQRAIQSAEARVRAATSAAAVSTAREAAGAELMHRVQTMADRGLVPRQKLTDQVNEYTIIRAETAAQFEQIEVERQLVALARQEIDDAVIRAPFGGVVTELNASVGEVVSPLSTGGFTRSGIGTIVDLSSLVAEIDISEQYLARIHVGQKVNLTTPAFPDRMLAGSIVLVSPRVDPATAAVTISVRFDTPEMGVFPGMRVDAAFLERDAAKP